jgi:hypothetical protein
LPTTATCPASSYDRLKARNLLARPKVSLLIFDPADQFRYLDVRGAARAEPDDGFAWADAFTTPKYGADVRDFREPTAW